MGDQLQLPKGAIWLLVLLVIGIVVWQVYNGHVVSEINAPGIGVKFSNSTPPVKDTMAHENLLVSNYHNMYLNERNLFGASIALDDSVKEALNDLPTGNVITTNGEITPTYGNKSNAIISSMNESMSVGTRVDLTGPSFDITPATNLTSQAQDIPQNNPGQNLAKWRWWVIPREEGSHTLFIEAYTMDEKGHRTSINSTKREIDVIVTLAPVTEEQANVTLSKNATPAPASKNIPGFEGILAITGLMAVAYLVLGRKS